MRKRDVPAVRNPERSEVAQLRNGHGRKRAAFQLLGYTHPRDKREPYLELNEPLDGLYRRQLERDV